MFVRLTIICVVLQSGTCLGNWAEERELRRTILKDMMAKKTMGTLRLDA